MINFFYLSFIVLAFAFSTHCLAHDEVRGLDDMKRTNRDRCAAYNSDSSEVQLGEIEKTKDGAIADYTDSINRFLTNKKNVNPKRHATEDEQRDILQPLMATAIIYGPTTTYANHGLSEGDALYWHFEILRTAEVLSFKYVESIKDYKNEKRRPYLAERQLEYDLLAKHGGITSDMFDMWFCEELAKHGSGFFNAANQGNLLPGLQQRNFTLYIRNNGERISNTVASGLESDLRTKKGTPLEHKGVAPRKYQMAVEGIKKEITKKNRRDRGELLPILKKKSSYSQSENVKKPNTGRKLQFLDGNVKGREMSGSGFARKGRTKRNLKDIMAIYDFISAKVMRTSIKESNKSDLECEQADIDLLNNNTFNNKDFSPELVGMVINPESVWFYKLEP